MAQSLPSSENVSQSRRPRGGGLQIGSLGFAVMITVLLVALLFAANQNTVIGWLLVAISAGWLLFAIIVFWQMRRGLRSAARRMDDAVARSADAMARPAEQAPVAASRREAAAPEAPASSGDPMRDTKLDHSFKICQVQTRVITEQLNQDGPLDREMVERALETITITASNARDMIKESGPAAGGASRRDAEGPVSGEVID